MPPYGVLAADYDPNYTTIVAPAVKTFHAVRTTNNNKGSEYQTTEAKSEDRRTTLSSSQKSLKMLSYQQCQQSPRTTTYSNYDVQDAKGSLDRAVKQMYTTTDVKLSDQKLKKRQSRSRFSEKLTKEVLNSESLTRRDSSELHDL